MEHDLLRHILDISRRMAETRDLESLLNEVMDEAISLVGAERGYVVLGMPNGALDLRVQRGQDGQSLADAHDQVSHSILRDVIDNGQPLVLRDAMGNSQFGAADSVVILGLRSIMCVPLVSRGDTIGAIYVENRSVRGRFREDDLPPLILFANQVAVAIQNARLFQELQEAHDTLERRVQERTADVQSLARFPDEDPNPVLRVDHSGTIVYANRGSRLLLDEWQCRVGQTLPQDWQLVVSDVLASGESRRAEVGVAGRVFSLTFAPVLSAGYANVYGLEITERKQAEKALLDASRMETAATLAAGVAHRVNNLMASVLGYAELLRASLEDRADLLADLDTISRSAEQAGELALQMLAFAHSGEHEPQLVNLNEVVENVLRLQGRTVPSEISVNCDAAPDLWEVYADPVRMSQVILDLLSNAVEAIDGDGSITITTQNLLVDEALGQRHDLAPGPHVCLAVQDSGNGMDDETLSRLFEPFFTTKVDGRGLGLAAVDGIVRAHGGHIAVSSQPGQGTTFKVCLPAV